MSGGTHTDTHTDTLVLRERTMHYALRYTHTHRHACVEEEDGALCLELHTHRHACVELA